MNELEVLIEARDLIADKRRWVTITYATNANGSTVMPTDDDAIAWCAMGAIYKVKNITPTQNNYFPRCEERNLIFDSVYELYNAPSISNVNDIMGHDAILAAFDLAIGRLQMKDTNPIADNILETV